MQGTLSERVRHLVRERGQMTLAQLEELTGVDSSMLSRIANGKTTTISADVAQRIFETLTGRKLELH